MQLVARTEVVYNSAFTQRRVAYNSDLARSQFLRRCLHYVMASAYDYDSDDDILEIATVALLVDCSQVRTKRSCWVRPWIATRRGQFGAYSALLAELEAEDTKAFSNFLRMNKSSFTDLLDRVSPLIAKRDTPMRDAIPPGEKLAITLRYLATGDSYKSLEYLYRIPSNTICGFIHHVCQAIYDSLKDDYLKVLLIFLLKIISRKQS
ncbi:uncharacterized protein [Haliotis cracherodii]|uniref:uncharacterized protein n=1 Tax=Haliotis cracherodii TaxID=6455 RepID=UPI0039EAF888